MRATLASLAAVLTALWGLVHVLPTRRVLASFEPITADNRRVLLQEWLTEAITMWSIAAVVLAATAAGSGSIVTSWVYRVAAMTQLVLAVLTAFTGARTDVIWYRICIGLLTVTAALLLVASFL
jgi:hypothetical protein